MEHFQHFGLTQDPFSNEPDLRFYFESGSHRDAQRRVERALRQHKGLTLLTGDGGMGKTLLARRILDALEEEVFEATLLVMHPGAADASGILQRFGRQIGCEEPSNDRAVLLGQIYEHLAIVREDGRHAVLMVDDAQVMTPGVLSELGGLLNLEYEDRRLVSLLLVGSSDLDALVQQDSSILPRVDVRVRLQPLDMANAAAYLSHRLASVRGNPELLPPQAMETLHKLGRGRPRLLNTLADNALFEAYLAGRPTIEPGDIERAAADLGIGSDPESDFTARPPAAVPPPPVATPTTVPTPPPVAAPTTVPPLPPPVAAPTTDVLAAPVTTPEEVEAISAGVVDLVDLDLDPEPVAASAPAPDTSAADGFDLAEAMADFDLTPEMETPGPLAAEPAPPPSPVLDLGLEAALDEFAEEADARAVASTPDASAPDHGPAALDATEASDPTAVPEATKASDPTAAPDALDVLDVLEETETSDATEVSETSGVSTLADDPLDFELEALDGDSLGQIDPVFDSEGFLGESLSGAADEKTEDPFDDASFSALEPPERPLPPATSSRPMPTPEPAIAGRAAPAPADPTRVELARVELQRLEPPRSESQRGESLAIESAGVELAGAELSPLALGDASELDDAFVELLED